MALLLLFVVHDQRARLTWKIVLVYVYVYVWNKACELRVALSIHQNGDQNVPSNAYLLPSLPLSLSLSLIVAPSPHPPLRKKNSHADARLDVIRQKPPSPSLPLGVPYRCFFGVCL